MADSSRIRDFPPEFLWGSSTAAHQVEGNNTNNDWWEWEHRAGSPVTEPSLDAIDHYHRYSSDFAMLAQLGQNAHRLSLEWARIEPEPGYFSRAALEHYRRVLAGLAEHRLTGVVTLQHFSLPRWLAERGGWLAPGAVDHFARYAARVAEALGDLMPWVGTINEPNVNGWLAYLAGAHPPGRIGRFDQWARAGEVARAAHRAAVAEFKAGSPASRIGLCLGSDLIVPARPDERCREFADRMRSGMTGAYLEDLAGDRQTAGDFIGVQYYHRLRADPDSPSGFTPPPVEDQATLMGWEVYPDGLRQALLLHAEAGLPLLVTESGIATRDDAQRVEYIRSHVTAVAEAMRAGVDVRGYFYWSSFDNFEWVEGYEPVFGLIAIDRAAGLRRDPRPSAYAYGRLATSGALAALDG